MNDSNYSQTTESTSDWVTPYTDNDPDDFWCTKVNTTKGAVLSPYECSAIKCVIERAVDTWDTTRDLKLTPGTDEYMVV